MTVMMIHIQNKNIQCSEAELCDKHFKQDYKDTASHSEVGQNHFLSHLSERSKNLH